MRACDWEVGWSHEFAGAPGGRMIGALLVGPPQAPLRDAKGLSAKGLKTFI